VWFWCGRCIYFTKPLTRQNSHTVNTHHHFPLLPLPSTSPLHDFPTQYVLLPLPMSTPFVAAKCLSNSFAIAPTSVQIETISKPCSNLALACSPDVQKIAAVLPADLAAFRIRWMADSCSVEPKGTFMNLLRSYGPIQSTSTLSQSGKMEGRGKGRSGRGIGQPDTPMKSTSIPSTFAISSTFSTPALDSI